jgi:hypothetical protein
MAADPKPREGRRKPAGTRPQPLPARDPQSAPAAEQRPSPAPSARKRRPRFVL